jgi:ATPase subunit of ABC transporter with duplicated ATPase domains
VFTSLAARGIAKSHGPLVVLDGIDLTIGPTTRAGVIGPNGIGKTTLLRILAGLEPPDRGTVRLSPKTTTVGYLPQEPDAAAGELLVDALARRTGVRAAEQDFDAASAALALDEPDADDRYAAALDRYLNLGCADFRPRAEAVCESLDLPADRLDVEVGHLSGGQAARSSLAAILLARFDVFLLDEPTNDLDFAGLDRLESFLAGIDGGVVVVSHDRAFLERTIDTVIEIDESSRTATEYHGGWGAYLDARATARRHQEEAFAGYQADKRRLEDRAREQRQWATTGARRAKKEAPDNDKAQRDWRVNRTEKQASKVRITEKALARLDEVDKPWEGWDLHLEIAAADRSGDFVAGLRGAVVDRGPFRLGPVDVDIAWAERVSILGANGSGKTTLINALLGRLALTRGEQRLGPGVVIGELDQGRRQLLGDDSLLETFSRAAAVSPQAARSTLAKLGLSADDVGRPAATLSPGERTRAALALLMARGSNCLVLDEPTNHLDMPAIEQLESALATYDGTLLLVTHDRRLLEAVHTNRVLAVDGGRVEEHAVPAQ